MFLRLFVAVLCAASAGSSQVLQAPRTTVDGLVIRDATALQAAINRSIAAGDAQLTVPEGAYYFDDGQPLLLYRARNWNLIAQGRVELWFRVTSNWTTGGVLILECEEVRVVGLTVDYDPPCYYQGTLQTDPAPSLGVRSGALVRTDPGFPDPYEFLAEHTATNDPSLNYVDSPALWTVATGFSCNRTLGCPGHGAATLLPHDASLPHGVAPFAVLPTARAGDKITIPIRKGITWHVQNSSRVTTSGVAIHSASLFGLSEFNGRGEHVYENVWLGRRRNVSMTQLCGRGRLCFGVLASNADAFHSSGCRRGPKLRNVTLSSNFDDFLNIHSRMQLVSQRLSDTALVIVDPRLAVAQGVPDDQPYGTAQTMPNVRPGDVLEFHALSTFTPLGNATVVSLERLSAPSDIDRAAKVAIDLDGRAPWNANPALNGGSVPDVGQLCGAFSEKYHLPRCASRVWRVTFREPLPPAVGQYNLVALSDWDASGAEVVDSQFFGGIDGIRWKSSNSRIVNSSLANTYLEVTPLQVYLEGPPSLSNITIADNTFVACDGLFGTTRVNCSSGLPVWGGSGGFCRGGGGRGEQDSGTCSDAVVRGNVKATSCCFEDAARTSTCCSSCGHACDCCVSDSPTVV